MTLSIATLNATLSETKLNAESWYIEQSDVFVLYTEYPIADVAAMENV
jgi:hypothetical protein